MNPLTNIKNQNKLNERELQLGVVGTGASWHNRYRESAWLFFGGIPFELSEGDLLCVFSQYGEIVNINLVRDKKTGKSKGFGFVCYEDQRSTDLAVDNFNGISLLGRQIRVDHVLNYRPPKEDEDETDIITKFLYNKGCAPEVIEEKLQKFRDAKEVKVKLEKKEDENLQGGRRVRVETKRRESRSRSKSPKKRHDDKDRERDKWQRKSRSRSPDRDRDRNRERDRRKSRSRTPTKHSSNKYSSTDRDRDRHRDRR